MGSGVGEFWASTGDGVDDEAAMSVVVVVVGPRE